MRTLTAPSPRLSTILLPCLLGAPGNRDFYLHLEVDNDDNEPSVSIVKMSPPSTVMSPMKRG